jgi:hypothetical protein
MATSVLEYPEFFDEKLKTNLKVRSAIDSSVALVGDILQLSKLPFFTDYTDHGAPHLNKVLRISDKLIGDAARQLFSAEDVAVLTFSILLHDLALHVSEAGFQSLLRAPNWADSWRDFLNTAKHWDDRKLVQVFGADEAGAPLALVKDPFDHYSNLTESDRKLIGEFIRRHHPQLAYEFAMAGFPGTDGQVIPFGPFDQDLRELAGIVARSHGFPLRDGIRQLEQKQFNKLEHGNVHPVFLMGILRVADFLDLGDNRAPLIAFAYKEFKSPLSMREWRTNQAFRAISWANPDPESIFIPAKPTDVYSYLELKQWLAAIQSELDMDWAVFGEVYAAHPKFSCLGLTIRRVRSNVTDDPAGFAKNASFVPMRVELGVAGPDVLKLFIEPLYGDYPEIGIRELMQNSVDAVRERWEFEKNHHLTDRTPSEPQGDVVIWLDDPNKRGVATLTVCDRGIGMTEEVIVNYFLKAGASFRRSVAWKKEFESELGVSQGHSKSRVLRSGRFGIGVLAAFLLGDEVEVATRHITSDRGIRFTMRLDLRPAALEIQPIQLTYSSDIPVGTTVKIKVTKIKEQEEEEDTATLFSDTKLWDWYCLGAPSVVRLKGKKKKALKQSHNVPAERPRLPRGWRRLQSSDYAAVHALLDPTRSADMPDLIVNGIIVEKPRKDKYIWSTERDTNLDTWLDILPHAELEPFSLRVPEFSIFDPDGNLPLNLQRTSLTNPQLDFMESAFDAQAKAALALLLVSIPEAPVLNDAFVTAIRAMFKIDEILPVFLTEFGAGLVTERNLREANVRRCLMVGIEQRGSPQLRRIQRRYDATIFFREYSHNDFDYDTKPDDPVDSVPGEIASVRQVGAGDYFEGRGEQELFEAGLTVFATEKCPRTRLTKKDRESLKEILSPGRYGDLPQLVAAEVWLKYPTASAVRSRQSVGRIWDQVMKSPVIPFDLVERRRKLKHAYDALTDLLADFVGPGRSRNRRKT